ncbi:MAG: lamin tail domain-containing protein [Patescibacteria group bacterium]
MTKRAIFIFSFLILATVVSAGFFIINDSWAAESISLIHNGIKNDYPDWQYNNVTTSVERLILNTATSTLFSPEIELPDCQSVEISYSIQTYYGVGTTSIIQISINHQDSIDLVDTKQPVSSSMTATTTDLTFYCGQTIKVGFSAPFADGRKGVGLDDINLIVSLTNQLPIAIATSSLTVATVGENIFFDGTNSTDDGTIVDWYWDFGEERPLVYASTTFYAYAASGVYSVYLSVTDNEGLSATSTPLIIAINPIATSTPATSTPTSTPSFSYSDIIINEIYPAPPTGEAEWLELYNNTSSTIDLAGLYLLDAKFSTTTLTGEIEAGGYLVIENISGNLNNDGDTIILRNVDLIISQIAYGDFSNKRDQSWARTAAGDYTATVRITKGLVNIIEAKAVVLTGGGSTSVLKTIETTSTSTTEATTTASTAENFSGRVIINELFNNPIGSDNDNEFIELLNISTSTVDLTGFVLADASNAKHLIKSSTTATTTNLIRPGGYFVFYRSDSDIALNNTGAESVNLYSPALQPLDRVEYLGENKEGISYSRTESGKWRWVKTPTPGTANAEDELYPDEENPALLAELPANSPKLVGIVKAVTASKKVAQNLTLEQLRNSASGDLVRVRGVVSVAPNVLSSQYFYISGSGVQVYCSKKDFPELAIGDYIEVSGEVAVSSAGRRVKISGRDQIKLIEHHAAPSPHAIATTDVGDDYEGYLVSLTGDILEIQSRNLIVDDGSGETKVYLHNAIDLKGLNAKAGDKITVTGIVGRTASGHRVMPRGADDIKIQKGEVKGAFAGAEVAPNSSPDYLVWYLGAVAVFLLFLVVILWRKLRKNKIDSD